MKRAQTEVLGLIVIVIILIVAGVFLVTMRLKKDNTTLSEFQNPELAHSFLNAVMYTKTEKGKVVFDIVKDCYTNRCSLGDSAEDCCDYAEETIKNALDKTLRERKQKYYVFSSQNCPDPT